MKLLFCTLFLTIAAAGVVLADEAAPSVYSLQLWYAPTGMGLARTIGPMTPKLCALSIEKQNHSTYTVPPDMQLTVHQCVAQFPLQTYLTGYNCVASGQKGVENQPAMTVWLYSCFRS